MQMVHKIMHKESSLDPQTWFKSAGDRAHATRSRSDPFNIKVRAGRLEVQRQFFSERVISDWNKILRPLKADQKRASRPHGGGYERDWRTLPRSGCARGETSRAMGIPEIDVLPADPSWVLGGSISKYTSK
jgi:hypothetical protein